MPRLIDYTCDLVTVFDRLSTVFRNGGDPSRIEFFTCATCGEEREDGYKTADRIICAECARGGDDA